jgi:hypothetical protein
MGTEVLSRGLSARGVKLPIYLHVVLTLRVGEGGQLNLLPFRAVGLTVYTSQTIAFADS